MMMMVEEATIATKTNTFSLVNANIAPLIEKSSTSSIINNKYDIVFIHIYIIYSYRFVSKYKYTFYVTHTHIYEYIY